MRQMFIPSVKQQSRKQLVIYLWAARQKAIHLVTAQFMKYEKATQAESM